MVMLNKPINLVTQLEKLSTEESDRFPAGDKINYYNLYKTAADLLNKDIHPQVEKLAMTIDGGYLTDHGPDHIKTVITREGDLIGCSCSLYPYEVFLLLVATQIHDVGNQDGRTDHEQRNREVLELCIPSLANDAITRRHISLIAAAHGGRTPDGRPKDTISALLPETKLNGQSIRPQLLAALLRFADELSDDKNRAARIALYTGKLPAESEIYHSYANALHSVAIDSLGGSVSLSFEINEDIATRTFTKGNRQVYLLDEIFERTLKMHYERAYCVRFMRSVAPIEKINVTVEIYNKAYSQRKKDIRYRLEDLGYPEVNSTDIYKLCPDLSVNGSKITGDSVSHELKPPSGA
jgi:hypothetical protein